MKKEYDFSKMECRRNPYAKKLKREKLINNILEMYDGANCHPQFIADYIIKNYLTYEQLKQLKTDMEKMRGIK